MKLDPVDSQQLPLHEIKTWYFSASVGDQVRISDLPREFFAASPDVIQDGINSVLLGYTIVEMDDPLVDVVAGDTLRTTQSYVVTKRR